MTVDPEETERIYWSDEPGAKDASTMPLGLPPAGASALTLFWRVRRDALPLRQGRNKGDGHSWLDPI
jgi:hypothetical protein